MLLTMHQNRCMSTMIFDKDEQINIPENLSCIMKEDNITMRMLSDARGVPYRSVQNYLSGKSRMPADVFVSFCSYLDVDINYIRTGKFNIYHWSLWDALYDVFGDGIFDFKFKEELSIDDDTFENRVKRTEIAKDVAIKLEKAYQQNRETDRKIYLKSHNHDDVEDKPNNETSA